MSYFLKPQLAVTLPQTINEIYTTIDVAYDIGFPAPAPLDVVTDKCALQSPSRKNMQEEKW
jgi:hypothetical protein